MRRFALACMIGLLACSCTTTDKRHSELMLGTPPQAKPVATFLLALQEKDMGLWRSVFSSRQQAYLQKRGLKSIFRGQRNHVMRGLAAFGDVDVADCSYSFSGDDKSGLVYPTLDNHPLGEMRVINEGGSWKLDEVDERK